MATDTTARRVLLVLDHAPDYREEFLRELGKLCRLTVLAQPCALDGLKPPERREGYRYIEGAVNRLGPFRWHQGFNTLLASEAWDVICVALNFHHPWRLLPFLARGDYRPKWVWWGQIYGANESALLKRVRASLMQQARGVLVYSTDIVNRLKIDMPSIEAVSFNNTQSRRASYGRVSFRPRAAGEARLLFVGRPQARKRLERLVLLAQRRSDVRVRLVGPGMKEFMEQAVGSAGPRVEYFGAAQGAALAEHFAWCDVVASPGHIGLLAVNAAQHGRPLVIQDNVVHAPEVIVAREAGQVFIDFEREDRVDALIERIKNDRQWLADLGKELQRVGVEGYTIEHMVARHVEVFDKVASHASAR